jgi:hypothetical protein
MAVPFHTAALGGKCPGKLFTDVEAMANALILTKANPSLFQVARTTIYHHPQVFANVLQQMNAKFRVHANLTGRALGRPLFRVLMAHFAIVFLTELARVAFV